MFLYLKLFEFKVLRLSDESSEKILRFLRIVESELFP